MKPCTDALDSRPLACVCRPRGEAAATLMIFDLQRPLLDLHLVSGATCRPLAPSAEQSAISQRLICLRATRSMFD